MNLITSLLLFSFAALSALKLGGVLNWPWLAVGAPLLLCAALFVTLGVMFKVLRIEHYGRG